MIENKVFTLKLTAYTEDIKDLQKYDLSGICDEMYTYEHSIQKHLIRLKHYSEKRAKMVTLEDHYCINKEIFGELETNEYTYNDMHPEVMHYLAYKIYNKYSIHNVEMVILYNKMLQFWEKRAFDEKSKELEELVKNRETVENEQGITRLDIIKTMLSIPEVFAENCENEFLKKINNYVHNVLLPEIKKDRRDKYESIMLLEDPNKDVSFLLDYVNDKIRHVMTSVMKFLTKECRPRFKLGAIGKDFFLVEINKNGNVDCNVISECIKKVMDYDVCVEHTLMTCDRLYELMEEQDETMADEKEESYLNWVKTYWEPMAFYLEKDLGKVVLEYHNELNLVEPLEIVQKLPFNPKIGDGFDKDHFMRWLGSKYKRSYYDMDFLPEPAPCPKDIYNLWKGFEFSNLPKPVLPEEKANFIMETFKKLIVHMSSDDPVLYSYLRSYIVDIIKNPGRKPGVGLLITSDQGSGKGTLCRYISGLIGSSFFYSTDDITQVFGQFTAPISKKLVVNLDEAVSIEMYSKNNRIKNFITEKDVKIEQKGVPSKQESSYHRIIITTNEKNPVKIEHTDRRLVVLTPDIIKDDEFLFDTNEILDNKEYMCYLFHELMNEEVPYKNSREWQMNRPYSEKYMELKSHNIPNQIQFLFDFLKSVKQDVNEFWFSNDDIYERYTNHCLKNSKNAMGCRSFMCELLKVDGIFSRKLGKKQLYGKLFTKDVVEKYLSTNYSYYIDYNTTVEELQEGVVGGEILEQLDEDKD